MIDTKQIEITIKAIESLYTSNNIKKGISKEVPNYFETIANRFISQKMVLHNYTMRKDRIFSWQIQDMFLSSKGNVKFHIKTNDISIENDLIPAILYSGTNINDYLSLNLQEQKITIKDIHWVYDRMRLSGVFLPKFASILKNNSIDNIIDEL